MIKLESLFWQILGKFPNVSATWDKGVHPDDPDQDGHPRRVANPYERTQ